MSKVANASGYHHQTKLIGRGNHFIIAHATARVDHAARACFGEHVNAIAEWKKCIGSDDGILETSLHFAP